jgi:thioredoxin 1
MTIPNNLRDTDDAHFDADVRSAPLVLVKFTAGWCPPCKAMQPAVEALAADRKDLLVLSVDVDSEQQVAQRYGVRAVPTLMTFKDGKPVSQRVGGQSRAGLDAMLR